jgi:hypothetical protein
VRIEKPTVLKVRLHWLEACWKMQPNCVTVLSDTAIRGKQGPGRSESNVCQGGG